MKAATAPEPPRRRRLPPPVPLHLKPPRRRSPRLALPLPLKAPHRPWTARLLRTLRQRRRASSTVDADSSPRTYTPAPAPQAADETVEPSGPLSPLVRRMAREHSIDLRKVQGTGAGGRITKQDIENYIARQQQDVSWAQPGTRSPGPPLRHRRCRPAPASRPSRKLRRALPRRKHLVPRRPFSRDPPRKCLRLRSRLPG